MISEGFHSANNHFLYLAKLSEKKTTSTGNQKIVSLERFIKKQKNNWFINFLSGLSKVVTCSFGINRVVLGKIHFRLVWFIDFFNRPETKLKFV